MELKVLTLNAWGLFVVSKHIKERLSAIADELPHYDIACLQEVWSTEDYEDIVSHLESTAMCYSHHFKSAIIGSGLCIFSKYPIISAIGHEYRVSAGMRRFKDGEVFAGKGVLCCKIETLNGIIAVYNTHLNGGRRQSHLIELMQFVRHTRGNFPVLISGDFNTVDKHTSYQLMTKCLGMTDVFSDEPHAVTCDLPNNAFTINNARRPKRVDFIFYSNEFCGDPACLHLISRRLALTDNIPGKDYPYSDHAGIEAVFNYQKEDINQKSNQFTKMNDSACQTLHKVHADIIDQRNKLYKFDVQKHAKMVVLGLVGSLLVVYLFLAIINEVLYDYHIHWLTMPIVGLTGALAAFMFFFLMNEIQLFSGMTANIDEISTILRYHNQDDKNSNNNVRITFS